MIMPGPLSGPGMLLYVSVIDRWRSTKWIISRIPHTGHFIGVDLGGTKIGFNTGGSEQCSAGQCGDADMS